MQSETENFLRELKNKRRKAAKRKSEYEYLARKEASDIEVLNKLIANLGDVCEGGIMEVKCYENFPTFIKAVLGKEEAGELIADGKLMREMMRQYPIEDIQRLAVVKNRQNVFLVPREQVRKITENQLKEASRMANNEGICGPIEFKINKQGFVELC